jgi:hypothetical protein
MRQISREQLLNRLIDPTPPCISFYQPTHRHFPETQQDPIRYKNMLKRLESVLEKQHPETDFDPLLTHFHSLSDDLDFWNHRTDGLVILATPEVFEVFEVQRSVPELVMVSSSFHIKPLLRIFQSADRFQILCLNRDEAKLFEGNRDALDPVDLLFPSTITDVLGEELTEPSLNKAAYGGASGGGSIGSAAGGSSRGGPGGGANSGAMPMVHGHGDSSEEGEKDRSRFFRAIGEGVLKYHSRPSGLPLILAALPEHHKSFIELCENPFLSKARIRKDPRQLDLDELRREAWESIEPLYLERLATLTERFQMARAKNLGTADLSDASHAAVLGRVDTLLLDADRLISGHIDQENGSIEVTKSDEAETEDMLDSLAEIVLKTSGEVVVVPSERMPTDSGLAAIYRY